MSNQKRAAQATLDVLRAAPEALSRPAIYKATRPALADLAQLPQPTGCTGNHADRAEYEVSWALHHLHRSGAIESPERGYWQIRS